MFKRTYQEMRFWEITFYLFIIVFNGLRLSVLFNYKYLVYTTDAKSAILV